MSLKDLMHVFVEDEEQAAPEQPKTQPTPIAAASPVAAVPAAAAQVDADQDGVYQRLLAKTDIDSHPTFQTLNKFLTPIANLPIDEKTRFRVAIQQAQANSGVDPASILSVFEEFKSTLQKAAQEFTANVERSMKSQVEAINSKAEEVAAQIQTLQAQAAQLKEQAFTNQQRIQSAQHRFDVALQQRTAELTQQQAKYASLIQ